MKIKLHQALLLGASLFCLHCTHKESRTPASTTKPLVTDKETQALLDILGGDSPTNNYRHPMRVHFYTSGDQKYLSETVRKSLQEALQKSLGTEAPEKALGKAVAGNLKAALIDNFITTLRVYKIINTGLQFDLSFVPQPNNKNDFSAEMSSNQLIRFNETGKLSRQWESMKPLPLINSLYNNSVYIPLQKGSTEYIGGVISIYVEILDASPRLRIPSVTKNGVKGFIRYRRYYRVNKDLASTLTCDQYALNIKRATEGVPLFYTTDLYKNFNLKDLIPTEETFEIYPGLLVPTNEGRHGLLPSAKQSAAGIAIPTATFSVNEKRPANNRSGFPIRKLVYDLKNNRFDTERSQVEGGVGARQFFTKCESSLDQLFSLDSTLHGGPQ